MGAPQVHVTEWKKLHTMWFQLCDLWEKAKLWSPRRSEVPRVWGREGCTGRAQQLLGSETVPCDMVLGAHVITVQTTKAQPGVALR